ncbi:hypothetical protein P4493_06305 [Bacillus thuringiensis]|jgi:hypothetical protein|uniref:Uncharacterized protein n=3 Tax=Bacillus thuringiensis TaxID=1428 RepID=A0A0B5NNT4_BACTU|nr:MULTISPECIES: hypothetical protein [Bacillus]EAO56511.1 hypothetical protein RBTH_07077 [Bacillus thuringiensis serovar israelensis ATCC 35646]MEC2533175.1 hypothetical protein [Bacillus cereus]MED1153843.1 hypothetical protein [Bacillus paranthracis]OUB09301.1 hypothetical protein BK708_32760 [Bacillus thuringiensis serovar yunnanensis]AFQ30155.1 hypothetical protein BTF1_30272 [Bacillus thuringiensis HD-789]
MLYAFVKYEDERPIFGSFKTVENQKQAEEEACNIIATYSNITKVEIFLYEQGAMNKVTTVYKKGVKDGVVELQIGEEE